jgi:excisionase family DNA binding protein
MRSSAEATPLRFGNQVEIIGERGGGLIECNVPLSLICTEDVPVNYEHVQRLAASIREESDKTQDGTGQLSPILLGEVNNEGLLYIIDGFHRCAALKEAEVDVAHATIRQSTWDDVIDLRILTARTHKTVQFARIVDWVNDSWARTPWSGKLSAAQAFYLYRHPDSRWRDIAPKDVEGIMDWVEVKSTLWKASASTIQSHLSVAGVADPELVKEARNSPRGDRMTRITPGHLKVIAKGLPLRFDIQRLVANTAVQQNLTIPETRSLVGMVADCRDREEGVKLIGEINWSAPVQREYSESQQRQLAAATFGAVAVNSSRKGVFEPAHGAINTAKQLLARIQANPTGTAYSPEALLAARAEVMSLARGLFDVTKIIESILGDNPPQAGVVHTEGRIISRERQPHQVASPRVETKALGVEDRDISSLLRTKDLAQIFDVTERTITNWVADGKLPCFRTAGGHIRFRQGDVTEFMNARSKRT